MAGSGGSECRYTTTSNYGDGRDYHNHWYQLVVRDDRRIERAEDLPRPHDLDRSGRR